MEITTHDYLLGYAHSDSSGRLPRARTIKRHSATSPI
jgi:hypothetical protein